MKVKGLQKTYDMKPGDQVTFEKASNNVMLKKVDPSNYSAWKEVVLEFENEPLNTIVSKLENRFKVRIEIDSLISARENLTMTIKDESLDEVLKLIRLSSSLKYKMSDDKVIIFE